MNSINAIIDMIATEAAEDDTGYAAADDLYRLRKALRKALTLLRDARDGLTTSRDECDHELIARIDAVTGDAQ